MDDPRKEDSSTGGTTERASGGAAASPEEPPAPSAGEAPTNAPDPGAGDADASAPGKSPAQAPGRASIKLSRAKLLAFALATTFLFFLLMELLCRAFYTSNCTSPGRFAAYLEEIGSTRPATLEESLRRSIPMPYDPYLIWHPVLNYRGPNLGVEVVHNSRGLRSPEIALEKPPDTARVLLMGDSTIYGHGVIDSKTLRTRLEALLHSSLPKRNIQVINGGVPGYSSLQSLNQLRRITGYYQPDILVVADLWSDCAPDTFEDKEVIYGTGIMQTLNRGWQRIDETLAPHSAFYCLLKEKVLRGAGKKCAGRPPLCAPPPDEVPGQTHADEAAFQPDQPSRGGHAPNGRRAPAGQGTSAGQEASAGPGTSAGQEASAGPGAPTNRKSKDRQGAQDRLNSQDRPGARDRRDRGANTVVQPGTSRPPNARPRVSPEDYEQNLEAIVAVARRHHARTIFVQLANGVELNEFDDPEDTMGDYSKYRDIMARVAQDEGCPLVQMVPAFKQEKELRSQPLFMDRVHPTALGHEVMATVVADALLNDPGCRSVLEGKPSGQGQAP